MKKDDNSGVSIKQIIFTALFLTVTTLGGLNIYRIVYDENVNTIQTIESANVENSQFESALVENTEDDFIYRENVKYMAINIVTKPSGSIVSRGNLLRDLNTSAIENKGDVSGDVAYENIVKDVLAIEEDNLGIEEDENKKLLNTVLNGIKEIGEIQDTIDEIQDNETQDTIGEIQNNETQVTIGKNQVDEIQNNEIQNAIVNNSELKENEKIASDNAELAEAQKTENVNVENKAESVNNENNTTEELGVPTEYVKTIDVKATAYCLCKKCCGKSPSNPNYGVTASGLRITPGTGMKVVASDPSVIPLGTQVYIEGLYGAKDYGYAVVADTGSAIKNLKIDLYMDTHQMALNWGVKTVRVYILDK